VSDERSREVARLRRLDLNLLVALDCLLTERGVSKAARRLGLSQSATSESLARLRRHFDDPLLHGVPRAYELSPLAQRLRPMVAEAVSATDRVFAALQGFDPQSDAVEFRFLGSSDAVAIAGPWLARVIAEGAPRARISIGVLPSGADPEKHLRDADGLLLMNADAIARAASIDIAEDDLVLLRDRDSDEVMDVEELSSRPWVCAYAGAGLDEPMGQLRAAGVDARVAVELADMAAVPLYVEGTDRLALIPRSVAERVGRDGAVRHQPPPLALDAIRVSLCWHPNRAGEAAHTWLRDVLTHAHRDHPSISAGPIVCIGSTVG
jgi:DNA-binding transcriptional LysR family regulator